MLLTNLVISFRAVLEDQKILYKILKTLPLFYTRELVNSSN